MELKVTSFFMASYSQEITASFGSFPRKLSNSEESSSISFTLFMIRFLSTLWNWDITTKSPFSSSGTSQHTYTNVLNNLHILHILNKTKKKTTSNNIILIFFLLIYTFQPVHSVNNKQHHNWMKWEILVYLDYVA